MRMDQERLPHTCWMWGEKELAVMAYAFNFSIQEAETGGGSFPIRQKTLSHKSAQFNELKQQTERRTCKQLIINGCKNTLQRAWVTVALARSWRHIPSIYVSSQLPVMPLPGNLMSLAFKHNSIPRYIIQNNKKKSLKPTWPTSNRDLKKNFKNVWSEDFTQ